MNPITLLGEISSRSSGSSFALPNIENRILSTAGQAHKIWSPSQLPGTGDIRCLPPSHILLLGPIDPIFTVSGPVDHYKAAIAAKMSAAKFQICPIFPNMFSDLPTYPRVQLVRRRGPPVAPYEETSSGKPDTASTKSIDVLGKDRTRFFCHVVNFPPPDLRYMEFPTFTIEKAEKIRRKPTQNAKVQTVFRDSEAQTIPWEPPFIVMDEGDPEILKLDFLKWGSGLPAGMHEVELIERARMKAAWDKAMKPNANDPNSLKLFRDYLEALERDEWAFREKEIQEIQDLRLELLEKMLAELHEHAKERTQTKLNRLIATKQAEIDEQIIKIRKKTARELRKLDARRMGIKQKYHETSIIEEHVNRASEVYGPLMRHGEHPKRWHQIIDEKMKTYRAQFIGNSITHLGVEMFSTLPRWLNQATKLSKYVPTKSTKTRLCQRETRWSAQVLKELHDELKKIRKETKRRPCSLRTRIDADVVESSTPEIEGIPQLEEDVYQATVLLQSYIRGRATQIMIYEGRDTCKELIQELKHSVGLLKKQKEQRAREKLIVKNQQRDETVQLNMIERLKGSLGRLQGSVVGTLLDFLNKELRRLLEERKVHAMCLLYERERCIREAAEAGRRQKELRRRREHDEIFKQIVKVTQDSVDMYLQDIITEGMEFASSEEATEFILRLTNRIEEETDALYEESIKVPLEEQDEQIADLVHHFVLPEVQKTLVRKKIKAQQKQNLRMVHETVYSRFETLPRIGRSEDQLEEEVSEVVSGLLKDMDDRVLYSDFTQFGLGPVDPYQTYLSQLVEQNEAADNMNNLDNTYDVNYCKQSPYFRSEGLDTITEVDSENSSIK
ncbi:hypothetical protein NQ317_010633 [Molorchus minor]|uniref:Cilia- and flagella-associated protein 91 n=1 Tax=Molorchus minor TaxID=1323400 RepID=A0ABQ9JD12_9CUCU|nr:hypothetical protein NQ317_010633 [Molorchus minor]